MPVSILLFLTQFPTQYSQAKTCLPTQDPKKYLIVIHIMITCYYFMVLTEHRTVSQVERMTLCLWLISEWKKGFGSKAFLVL